MPLRALIDFVLAQVWLSTSHFEFELEVDRSSVTTDGSNCNDAFFDSCRIYFSLFCLRERGEDSQSTNTGDCPLGENTERLNAYEGTQNNIQRKITSQRPWPVRLV